MAREPENYESNGIENEEDQVESIDIMGDAGDEDSEWTFPEGDDNQRRISEIELKDIYITIQDGCEDDPISYNPKHQKDGSTHCLMIESNEFDNDIDQLRNDLRKHAHYEQFKASNGKTPLKRKFALSHDNIRYRVSCYQVLQGKIVCSMRRFPKEFPDINNLNLEQGWIDAFYSVGETRQRGGLILVGGRTGAGKTTTLIAVIRMFLQEFGGFLYSVEDPVEYVLQGRFKGNERNANVFQREVETENEWAEGIEDALRSAPQYVFIGEIRTPLAAAQAIRAASTGHLVITTTHGGSVEQTISTFLQTARIEMGDLAAPQLADCLRLVAHQEIVNAKPKIELLSLDGENSHSIRANIEEGVKGLKKLSSAIQQQQAIRSRSGARAPQRMGSGQGSVPSPQRRPPQGQPQRRPAPPQSPPPKKKGGLFNRSK